MAEVFVQTLTFGDYQEGYSSEELVGQPGVADSRTTKKIVKRVDA